MDKKERKLDYDIPVENKEIIEDKPMDIYPKIDYTIAPNQLDNAEVVDNALSLDPQASVFENAEQAEAWTDKAINIPSAVKEELEEDGEISADGDKDTVYDNADATTQAAIDDYATSDSVYLPEDTVEPEEPVVEESSVSDEEVSTPDEEIGDSLKYEHDIATEESTDTLGDTLKNEKDASTDEGSNETLGDALKNAAEEKVGYNLWDSIIKGV